MTTKRTNTWFTTIAFAILFSISTVTLASAQTRQSDSLLNGALIGAGAGVATHLLVCRTMEPWEVCRNDFGPMATFGALGAGIGIGIDALIRKTIYQSASGDTEVHATPIIGRRAKGMRFSVRF